MGKKLDDVTRMYVAIQKIDFKPVIAEMHHNPLWLLAFIVLFFALGNLLEILWMILKEVKLSLLKYLRYPTKKVREVATKFRRRFRRMRNKSKR